jgi:hypothetical protein
MAQPVYGYVGDRPVGPQPRPVGPQPRPVGPQQQPVVLQPRSYIYNARHMVNPYAMKWADYSGSLKPFLDELYPVRPPAPGRPVQARAAAEVGGRGEALTAIKAALKLPNSPLQTSNPVWDEVRINTFVNSANQAVPALADGVAFNIENFVTSILPELNNLNRQNSNRGNAPLLDAPIAIVRANIGV